MHTSNARPAMHTSNAVTNVTDGRTYGDPQSPTSETSSSVTRGRTYEISAIVTESDFARMPWHAQQKLIGRMRREYRALQDAITQLDKAHGHRVSDALNMAEANRILAALPIDPDALKHQHELAAALAEVDGYRRGAA